TPPPVPVILSSWCHILSPVRHPHLCQTPPPVPVILSSWCHILSPVRYPHLCQTPPCHTPSP
ncbi:hypothetical protein NDU88_008792, partial [Pleurodeles waltl]